MTTLTEELDAMVAARSQAPGVGDWFDDPSKDPVFAALCEVARAAKPFGDSKTRASFEDAPDDTRHWQCFVSADQLSELRDALTALERALEDGRD